MRALAPGLLLATLVSVPAADAQHLSTIQPGYAAGSINTFSDQCGGPFSTAGFSDGSYAAYDGTTLDIRTAEGLVIDRLVTFQGFVFPSFVAVSPDEQTIVFGESSTGLIRSIARSGGPVTVLASVTFNFDLAFDVDPNFAYVSAASGGFGTNSVHRLNLLSGTTEEVASVTGFSGPITVTDDGDVLLGRLPDVFPFPSGATEVVRFTDAELDAGVLLTDADAAVVTPGLNGLSSLVWDRGNDQLFLMETNAGASGFGALLWRADAAGTPIEVVAEADTFSGGIELVDLGVGTKFGPYQPPFAGLRYSTNNCFGTPAISERITVRGARPGNSWSGPPVGVSDMATFTLTGGIVDGFAALWAARSNTFSTVDVVTDIGGFYPIALSANNSSDFIRRFAPVQIDFLGEAEFTYFHTPVLDAAFIGQWVMFDENMNPITTTRAVLNR